MTTTPQLKLRGIFLAGDLPENLTNTVGDIFSNVVSAVSNFFQHLISLFNQKFPPETRDEQIHWLLHGATPYLIGAAVLVVCLCLLSCFSCIFVGIYNLICTIFRCICRCLCCGRRWGVRMMKAPGRPSLMLRRSAFEGNPSASRRTAVGRLGGRARKSARDEVPVGDRRGPEEGWSPSR
ncbi:hypothetical protein R6Q57_015299 [Mikania cordata]